MENKKLTNRLSEILNLLDEGLSRKLISDELGISKNTVNTQVNLLYKIYDAHSATECLHKAREKGDLPEANKKPSENNNGEVS